jgi:hypothetical protein
MYILYCIGFEPAGYVLPGGVERISSPGEKEIRTRTGKPSPGHQVFFGHIIVIVSQMGPLTQEKS